MRLFAFGMAVFLTSAAVVLAYVVNYADPAALVPMKRADLWLVFAVVAPLYLIFALKDD